MSQNSPHHRYTDTATHKISMLVAIFVLGAYIIPLTIKYPTKIANVDELDVLVQEIAPKYHLDPALILAIIEVESQGNPHAISSARAYGLMQIRIDTARYYVKSSTITAQEIRDKLLNDQYFNIDVGCRHLKMLIDKALAKYSGGARGYARKVELAMRGEKNERD